MDAAAALSDALTAGRPVGIRAAAMSDDVDELARLLDAGVPVDYADGAPGTPLLSALAHGASDAAAFLVAAGCALDAEDPATGGGVIHAAARSPDPSSSALVLRSCHAACVPMDARDHAGRTPLEIAMRHRPRAPNSAAVSRGAYRVLVAILDAGASPDVPFSAGAHPLAVAVAAGARDVVELLLERGACPDGEPPSGYGRGPADAPDLKPAGTGIEPTTSERANARGAVGDRPRGARRRDDAPWFDGGEDARGRRTRATPLLLAVSERRPDLVTTLMDAGADPELAAPCDAEAIRAAREAGGDARWTPGPDEDSSSPEPDAERNLDANGDRSTTTNGNRSTTTNGDRLTTTNGDRSTTTRTPSSPRDIVRDVDETARAFGDSEGSDSDPSNRAFRPQPRARTGTEIRTKTSASAPRLVRPLQLAASLGDVACASALMDAGARLDVPADMPPLVCAAAAGRVSTTREILRRGADPLTGDVRGATALHYAAARGHAETCRALAEVIAEIEEDERAEREAAAPSAMSCAALSPAGFLAKLFVGFGSPAATGAGAGETRDWSDVYGEEHSRVGTVARGDGGVTPRDSADASSDPPSVSLVDGRDADGQTALYAACAEGHAAVATVLVDAGADPTARFPPDGATLLHVAAAYDRADVIRFLLRDEFDAREGTDRTGRGTRAGEATKSGGEGDGGGDEGGDGGGDVAHVSGFDASAPSSARSPHPSSALDVSALRSRGTEPHRAPKKDARDNLGRTPLYIAAAAGATRALLALCDVGADLDAAPERPETRRRRDEHDRDAFDGVSSVDAPVAAAARRGDMREVQELVRRGADPGPARALGAPLVRTPTTFHAHATLAGHTRSVSGIAFHRRDAAICATVGEDGALRVHREAAPGEWDLGVSFRCHDASAGGVAGLAWSPAGSDAIVTAGGDGRCCVWRLPKTRKGPSAVMECGAPVAGACWSPDDGRVFAACGPAVLTFDAATGEQTGQMRRWSDEPGAKDRTTGCAHARRGSILASTGAGEGAVTLWDTTAATCLGAMFGGASVASANPNPGVVVSRGASFSPDDRRLVTCDSHGWVRVWDVANRARVSSWRAHRGGGVADCAFSPDGAWVATASADGTARLWDPSDGRELACLGDGRESSFSAVAFAPTGALLAAATETPPEELLHSRGYNVGVLWEGKYGA